MPGTPIVKDETLTLDSKTDVLKAVAVNKAMREVIEENRAEIIKRARAKLASLGVEITDAEVGV